MESEKQKFGIVLRCKHTGEEIRLGGQYNSKEDAKKNAEKDICLRCNSFRIIALQKNPVSISKKQGLKSQTTHAVQIASQEDRDGS